ncbi:hypothetical protein AC731_007105 [Thauera humireducens]|uniref:Phage portal protein n=2 Tax=Thauera humireducens TaxID=1134435 RepID=A0A127K440_9RHOO|nr:hypothetical protein AC731_007105 [Thauera humireducens]
MGILDFLFRRGGEASDARMVEASGATVDPDDEEGWRRLSGDANRDLSPLSQERMRETALYLWDANLLANRIIELPLAYMLAEGVELRATEPEMQETINRFWSDPINSMDVKLPKKVRELAIFGEQVWPTFVNEMSGHVRLGYLDPALIATVVVDPDNPEQPIGIVTVKDRKGRALRYRVIVNGPETVFTQRTQAIRETFADGEAFFFTVNDLSVSRRGRSDLRAPADWVDGYDQFLFGEIERYNFLRAFVWDVTITGADDTKIKQKAREIKPPTPGSVRVHNDSEKWQAVSPEIGAYESAAAGRLFRNHVLGGATIPEHWFGGGGDVNRATGDSMGEPTFKAFSMRQRFLKHMLESVGRYVIRQKLIAETGEPDWWDERLGCEAVFPEMTARDTTKYAAALTQVVTAVNSAIDAGRMSDETGVALIAAVAGRLGVEIDPEAELTAARKGKLKRQEEDSFTGPGDLVDEEDEAAQASALAAASREAGQ